MTVPYQETGRTQQKARTLDALVAATRELLASGVNPTVEEVAALARVSRTTAYRYFPTQHGLLLAAYPEIARESVLGDDPPEDVGARLDLALAEMARQLTENEAPLRAMLRLSLGRPAERGELLLRKGRRRIWVADALAPLEPELGERDFERLVLSITVTTGIEAYVWLRDVAGSSRADALDLMASSARTLLAASAGSQRADPAAPTIEP